MTEMQINWQNDELKQAFANAGLNSLEDFLEIEVKEDALKLQPMRNHQDKETGEIIRKMTRIDLNGQVFYLKRAFGASLPNIENEFTAIKLLPEFGLIPCKVAASCFDDEASRGFLLLENLDGFHPIKEILKKNAPEDIQEDFAKRKDEIFRKIAGIIREVHKKGYVYPDWFAKHLYVKKGSDEIALIDLERFRHVDNCPWYFSFPVTSGFVRRKIFKKLRISLERESDLLTHKYLEGILHE